MTTRILDFADGFTSALPPSVTEIPISVLVQETPSGTIDGVNVTFVLAQEPIDADNLLVFVDGILRPKTEWSLSTATITFGGSHIPVDGQNVYCAYMVEAASTGGGGGGGGGSAIDAHGSKASPSQIVPASGLTPTAENDQIWWLAPLSGGATPITANPQIGAGTTIGQRLTIVGTDATNYYTLADGNGLDLNGPINLDDNQSIVLHWDGTNWTEIARRQ